MCTGGGYGGGQGQGMPQWGRPQSISDGPGRMGGMDGNKMGLMQNFDPYSYGGYGNQRPMPMPYQNPYSGARIGSTVGSQMMGMPEQGQYPQNPYKGGGAQESIFGQGYTPMSSQGQYNPQMQQLMQAMMGPRMMTQTSQVPQQAQGQIQPGWNGGY